MSDIPNMTEPEVLINVTEAPAVQPVITDKEATDPEPTADTKTAAESKPKLLIKTPEALAVQPVGPVKEAPEPKSTSDIKPIIEPEVLIIDITETSYVPSVSLVNEATELKPMTDIEPTTESKDAPESTEVAEPVHADPSPLVDASRHASVSHHDGGSEHSGVTEHTSASGHAIESAKDKEPSSLTKQSGSDTDTQPAGVTKAAKDGQDTVNTTSVEQPSDAVKTTSAEQVASTATSTAIEQKPAAAPEPTTPTRPARSIPPHLRNQGFPPPSPRKQPSSGLGSSKYMTPSELTQFNNNTTRASRSSYSLYDTPSPRQRGTFGDREEIARLQAQVIKMRADLDAERAVTANLHRTYYKEFQDKFENTCSKLLTSVLSDQANALAAKDKVEAKELDLSFREQHIHMIEIFLAKGQKYLSGALEKNGDTPISTVQAEHIRCEATLATQKNLAVATASLKTQVETLSLRVEAQSKREECYKAAIYDQAIAEVEKRVDAATVFEEGVKAGKNTAVVTTQEQLKHEYDRGFSAGNLASDKQAQREELDLAYTNGFEAAKQEAAATAGLEEKAGANLSYAQGFAAGKEAAGAGVVSTTTTTTTTETKTTAPLQKEEHVHTDAFLTGYSVARRSQVLLAKLRKGEIAADSAELEFLFDAEHPHNPGNVCEKIGRMEGAGGEGGSTETEKKMTDKGKGPAVNDKAAPVTVDNTVPVTGTDYLTGPPTTNANDTGNSPSSLSSISSTTTTSSIPAIPLSSSPPPIVFNPYPRRFHNLPPYNRPTFAAELRGPVPMYKGEVVLANHAALAVVEAREEEERAERKKAREAEGEALIDL